MADLQVEGVSIYFLPFTFYFKFKYLVFKIGFSLCKLKFKNYLCILRLSVCFLLIDMVMIKKDKTT